MSLPSINASGVVADDRSTATGKSQSEREVAASSHAAERSATDDSRYLSLRLPPLRKPRCDGLGYSRALARGRPGVR